MPISTLPAAPSRSDPPATFIAKADAFVAALGTLVTEVNAALGVTNMTKWISGTTYAIGDVTWSPTDFQAYRRKIAGAGTTDPSLDTTNWQRTEVSLSTLVAQTATACTTAGTAPAFTLTPSPAITAYAANQRYRVKFNAAGTIGSNTLNVSGLGAKNIKQYDASGNKVPGVAGLSQLADLEYDGTDFVLLTPLPTVDIGSVIYVAFNSAPIGYLKANGAAISRTTYASLFAKIGTTFGVGDGATTFNVPDLRGEFIRGWDDARGVDSGRAIGTAQTDEFKTHTHGIAMNTAGATTWVPGPSSSSPGNSGTTAANGGTETRPRNVALLACIKF